METNEEQLINAFKQSYHYRDICYMVDHVPYREIMISCIEDLDYKIGLNLIRTSDKTNLKSVSIGKKGEYRVQLTKPENNLIICAIVDRES